MLSIQTGLCRHKGINGFIIYFVYDGKLRKFRLRVFLFRLSICTGILRLYYFEKHLALERCRCILRCSKINIHNIRQ